MSGGRWLGLGLRFTKPSYSIFNIINLTSPRRQSVDFVLFVCFVLVPAWLRWLWGPSRDCMRSDFGVLTYLMHLVPVITHHFDPELSAFVSKCKVKKQLLYLLYPLLECFDNSSIKESIQLLS